MFQFHGQLVELEYREYQLPPEFPCMALLRGEFTFPISQAGPLTYLHFHNCLEIGIGYAGFKDVFIEEKHSIFQPDDICVIPPYAMHISRHMGNPDNDDFEYLYFKPEEILKPFYPNGIPKFLLWYKEDRLTDIFPKSEYPVLYGLLTSILEELRQKNDFYQNSVRGLLLSLMVEFSRILQPEQQGSSPRYKDMTLILPALEYISKNYATPLDTEELAGLCHLSVGHFRRIFKLMMMQSPSGYIRMIQLQKACELLYSTEKNILDIALESGFQSLSAFNRAFLKTYQKSPSRWRSEKCSVQKKHVKYSPFLPVN